MEIKSRQGRGALQDYCKPFTMHSCRHLRLPDMHHIIGHFHLVAIDLIPWLASGVFQKINDARGDKIRPARIAVPAKVAHSVLEYKGAVESAMYDMPAIVQQRAHMLVAPLLSLGCNLYA